MDDMTAGNKRPSGITPVIISSHDAFITKPKTGAIMLFYYFFVVRFLAERLSELRNHIPESVLAGYFREEFVINILDGLLNEFKESYSPGHSIEKDILDEFMGEV